MKAALPVIAALNLKGVSHKKVLKVSEPLTADRTHFLQVAGHDWKKGRAEASSAWEKAQQVIEKCKANDIHPITFLDGGQYPERLDVLSKTPKAKGGYSDERPAVIYVKGDVEALRHKSPVVAIVGTRKPTPQGKKHSREFGRSAARKKIPVVSGLAYGCDQYGHEGCMDENGTAIAVLAHGLDHIYPLANKELADKILENGGCWISEYPPGEEVRRWMFVARDRLQSALSDVVIVIQTGLEGGTQHTIRFAREQERRIACVVPVASDWHNRIVAGNRELLGNDPNVIRLEEFSDLEPLLKEVREAAETAAAQP